eukprot:52448-Chlamydomonas_euryale.AAC.2
MSRQHANAALLPDTRAQTPGTHNHAAGPPQRLTPGTHNHAAGPPQSLTLEPLMTWVTDPPRWLRGGCKGIHATWHFVLLEAATLLIFAYMSWASYRRPRSQSQSKTCLTLTPLRLK